MLVSWTKDRVQTNGLQDSSSIYKGLLLSFSIKIPTCFNSSWDCFGGLISFTNFWRLKLKSTSVLRVAKTDIFLCNLNLSLYQQGIINSAVWNNCCHFVLIDFFFHVFLLYGKEWPCCLFIAVMETVKERAQKYIDYGRSSQLLFNSIKALSYDHLLDIYREQFVYE